MNSKNLLYGLLCISFTSIVGAGIYEQFVIWPTAFVAPPVSLNMFQGDYGVNPVIFWSKIHPITLVLFIISLVLNWKSERRNHVLIPFVTYIIVILFTFLYFVPELVEIVRTPFSDQVDANLVSKGSTWQVLSFVRLVVILGMALFMYLGLTKNPAQKTK